MEKPIVWPNGARCAVLITFDVDGESCTGQNLGGMTMTDDGQDILFRQHTYAQYGPQVAVRRFLDVLRKEDLPAAFFVPARIALIYPDLIRQIADLGFEIGNHGYDHENFMRYPTEEQRQIILRSQKVLEDLTGKRPVSYRTPGGDIDDKQLEMMYQEGFRASCCMWGDDVPSRVVFNGKDSDMVEMPSKWATNDHPLFCYSWSPNGGEYAQAPVASYSDAFENIRMEFEGCYRYGTLFTWTLHPNVSGRPGRFKNFLKMIKYMKSFGDIWFTTPSEMAAWYISCY